MRVATCIFAAGIAAAMGACQLNIFASDRNLDFEASEPFSVVLDASDAASLRLDGISGQITIAGDAVSTDVELDALLTVRSSSRLDAQDFLSRVTVEVADVGDEIRIRTDQPNNTGGREVIVDYEITLPDYLSLQIANVNGEVTISSVDAAVTVDNVNGLVDVSDVVGDADATVVNGDLDVDLTLLPGGHADLGVVNGNMTLRVPASVSAMLEADAVNGIVTVTGLTISDATTTSRSVHGRLGGGDGLIQLDVTNGTITVRAR